MAQHDGRRARGSTASRIDESRRRMRVDGRALALGAAADEFAAADVRRRGRRDRLMAKDAYRPTRWRSRSRSGGLGRNRLRFQLAPGESRRGRSTCRFRRIPDGCSKTASVVPCGERSGGIRSRAAGGGASKSGAKRPTRSNCCVPPQASGRGEHDPLDARLHPHQSGRLCDSPRVAVLRAVVDSRRLAHVGGAVPVRHGESRPRSSSIGTGRSSSRAARCRASSTTAGPIRCRRTTATASTSWR